MKTYLKTLGRMFGKHFMRFFSIIFIVVVSVGLISGIGSSSEKIYDSLTDFYISQHVSDFIVKSTSQSGLTDAHTDAVRMLYGAENVNMGASFDVGMTLQGEESTVRLYFLDFAEWTINLPVHVSGLSYREIAEEENPEQILCVQETTGLKALEVGEPVTLDFENFLTQSAEQSGTPLDDVTKAMLAALEKKTVTVGGIVQSALAFTKDGEPSYIQDDGYVAPDSVNGLDGLNTLDYIFYLPSSLIPKLYGNPVLPMQDLYIACPDRTVFDSFSSKYKDCVAFETEKLGVIPDVEVLTLYDNYSFRSLNAYGDKVTAIGVVFLIAFIFVTALVVSSNMTRLLEEERAQIACLRTLGYGGGKILFKYLLFVLLATGISGVASYFLGLGLASLIYYVFNYSYIMPPMSGSVAIVSYLVTFFAIVLATVAATVIEGVRLIRETPADLLRPHPPKAGKKVFVERIPPIWNRLSFKYKSTMRNVLRYRNRFFMTVISVACSMGLVLAGLGVLDLCLFHGLSSGALIGLALVIVIFAGLLTMAVIYTLTGINISERNREIATLMVLGYFDGEVTGYIYREIYINTAIGIVFGYPVGALLVWAVFTVMNFGSLGGMSWFMWLIAPFVVLLFTALITLLLRRKIVKIDMNDSLKAIE